MKQNKERPLPNEKLKSPFEIYRIGWLIISATAGIYLVSFIIKNSVGMHYEVVQRPQFHKETKITNPRKTEYKSQYTSSDRLSAETVNRNNQYRKLASQQNLEKKPMQKLALNDRFETHKVRYVRNEVRGDRRTPSKNQIVKPQATSNFYIKQPSYVDSFTYDIPLQKFDEMEQSQAMTPKKKKKRTLFGVHLVKGKSIPEVRRNWHRLRKKYRKHFRNLEPLIIKENTGDGRPIKLVLGPFPDALLAVKLCKRLKRRNCNIKLYNGTPL